MAKKPVKKAFAVPTLVQQSNTLTNAIYTLSMPAKRVLSICMAEMSAQDAKMGAAFIDHQLYKKHFPSSDSRVAADLSAGMKELLGSFLRFPSPDPAFENRYIPWLEHIDTIEENTPNATYGILFHDEVRPHIGMIDERFTLYDLKHCGKFTSVNQMRLYECLCQWKSTGLWFLSSHEFIHGGRFKFSKTLQKNAFAVKKDFIAKAIEKINDNTPLFVTFRDDAGQFIFSILSGKAAETAKANARKKALAGEVAAKQLQIEESEND